MRFAAVIALALIVAVAAHGDHGHDHDHDHAGHDSHVVVLTTSNFDAEVAKNPLMLVEFYAPWCGHCKKLAPEYEKSAHDLEGKGATLAKIDCTAEQSVCSKYDVKGYPTLKVFRNDGSKPSEYPGGRTADAITKFMLKQNAPAYVDVASEEAINALVGKDIVVVGFFDDASSDEAKAFIATANALRNDYSFALAAGSHAAPLAAKFGDSSLPAAVLFKPTAFGEENAIFDGTFAQEALAAFVNREAFPLLGEIGPDNYQKYLERKLPLLWAFLDKDAATFEPLKTAIRGAAASFKGKLSFVWLDGVRWADHAKNFGVKGKPPGIVIEDRDKDKKYVMDQTAEVTTESVRAHAQGWADGTLAPTVKTQEIPADNTGPVKVVVGKNFDSLVLDDSKDVFVEFYAPWCGHCKSLAPKWEELGKTFASEPSIVIAKCDATENDTPAQIKGFPTLIFYPAGAKSSPIPYNGERNEEAMAAFVREKATTLKGKGKAADKHDEL